MIDKEHKIYSAFGSPQAAAAATGGEVYAVKGDDVGNAFILSDAKGNQFVYVKAEYKGYRELANRVAGERISHAGDDADHVASRTIAGERGGQYVLLARVPSRANRSASRVEKLNVLDGHFNYAAAQRSADGHLALAITHRQVQKIRGRKIEEYDRQTMSAADILADADTRRALLQTPDDQNRIATMKGERIAMHDPKKDDVARVAPVATGITGPWDRHLAEKSAPRPSPPNRKK